MLTGEMEEEVVVGVVGVVVVVVVGVEGRGGAAASGVTVAA